MTQTTTAVIENIINQGNENTLSDHIVILTREEALQNENLKEYSSFSYSFRKILLIKDLNITNNSGFIRSNLNLNTLRESCDGLILINCELDGDLILNLNSKYKVFSSVFIINSLIRGQIILTQKVPANVLIDKSSILKGINTKQSGEVATKVIITNCNILEGNIDLINKPQITNLEISNTILGSGSINTKDATIATCKIEHVSVTESISLWGKIASTTLKDIKLQNLDFNIQEGDCSLSNIDSEDFKVHQTTLIYSLTFEENLAVTNGISLFGHYKLVEFKNAIVQSPILNIPPDTTIESLRIDSSVIKPNIRIDKSNIITTKIFNNSTLRDLCLTDCVIDTFQIEDTIFEYNLMFSNTIISTSLSIEDTKILDNFSIRSATAGEGKKDKGFHLYLSNLLVIENLDFSNSLFQSIDSSKLITLKFCTLSTITVFDECTFSNTLQPLGLKINENSKLKNLSFYEWRGNKLSIEQGNIESNKIEFTNCYFDTFTPSEYSKFEYLFLDCRFNYISLINRTNPKDVVFTFINCEISILEISHFNNLGNLFLRNIYAIPIILKNPERFEEVRDIENKDFESVLKNYDKYVNFEKHSFSIPTLILNQSSLGKAEFTNCNFDDFQFLYSNSKITETFISGGKMPQTINVHGIDESKNPDEFHTQKVAVYNQFKKIFENQGDIFQSSSYQAKASENQEKLLRCKTKFNIENIKRQSHSRYETKWLIFKEKYLSQNSWERATFSLNESSNNHGESWSKALKFTILIGLLTFIPFLFSNRYLLDLNVLFHPSKFSLDVDWKFLTNNVHYFFDFIIPTHKSDLIEDVTNPSAWSGFWDILGRIFVGYGIFQFIAAFRKHSKK